MKKRAVSVMLTAAMVSAMLAGCGSKNAETQSAADTTAESAVSGDETSADTQAADAETTDASKTDGTFTVGFDQDFPPMGFVGDDGEFTGFDLEMAAEVAKRLNLTIAYQPIAWDAKDMELDAGTIDCIWSCYSMNDRENDYQWAGPYLYSRQVIAVASDSDIQTFDDLLGKNVGVQDTTRAAELFFHTIDSALPEVKQVNCFATTEDMFAALRKGYVDAIAGHEALLNELIINGKGKYRLLDESPYISKIGIAFQKGTHEKLTKKINGLIKEMSEDGTIGSIAEKYGLDAEKVVIRGGSDEK